MVVEDRVMAYRRVSRRIPNSWAEKQVVNAANGSIQGHTAHVPQSFTRPAPTWIVLSLL